MNQALTNGPALSPRPGSDGAFSLDAPVFAPTLGLLPGVAVPAFGDTSVWPAACLRRPSNVLPSEWSIRFPHDPVWNLLAREIAFALLNPTHPVLRAASVFWPTKPAKLRTVRGQMSRINTLARYAAAADLPQQIGRWSKDDWEGFLAALPDFGVRAEGSRTGYRSLLRNLYELRDVLTAGGPDINPVSRPRRTAKPAVTTRPVPPATWWPLLRAAWTYIDTFASDILAAVDTLSPSATPQPRSSAGAAGARPNAIDAALGTWLADPAAVVPVHAEPYQGAGAGTPVWAAISRALTDSRTASAFAADRPGGVRRRQLVLDAVASGRGQPVSHLGATHLVTGTIHTPAGPPGASARAMTDRLMRWLADPGHRVPLAYRRPGSPQVVNWAELSRLVYGSAQGPAFRTTTAAGRERRTLVQNALAQGRGQPAEWAGVQDGLVDCSGFTEVTRTDGSRGPWRRSLTRRQLNGELRALMAACYVFITALSMMRDSEVQELQRGALTEHFGTPAVRSLKHKGEATPAEKLWWIIDPVAQAIAVLEALSWHPTHLFATARLPPRHAGRQPAGRRGIRSEEHLDSFIAHVNSHRHDTGLTQIPPDTVRPHQLRKTMSVICGQQPDGEIALGIQLKHAARRALANRTTHGYAEPDAAWAKEFDTQLELAAAKKLAGLLADRARGLNVAVGPGADRFHAGLDHVLDTLAAGEPSGLHALHADDRTAITLLRQEFTDLRLGTLNHCLWQPETAECQTALPPDQRGQAPLLGACQPGRCRNSAVTAHHAPIWLAEQQDLTHMLKGKRLAPARREALNERLAEVTRITTALSQEPR